MNEKQQFEQDKEILSRGINLGDGEILETDSENTPVFTMHAQNPTETINRIAEILGSRG